MNMKSMHTGKLVTLTAIGALAALLSLPTLAMPMDPLGTAVQAGKADREVTLADGAKHLNVQRDETVKINVGGKSFTWRFDTFGLPVIKLSEIAPADFGAKDVKIYISVDPARL